MNESEMIDRALDLCSRGFWTQGLQFLSRITGVKSMKGRHPALVYSYYGYGLALCERRFKEGIALCEHAIKMEFYQPMHYYNLARIQILRGNRMAAVKSIQSGLKVDPENEKLKALAREAGVRRSPVLPFLPRSNGLNIMLGKIRHRMLAKR
jgi:tetratricopeptide (TPR) repeat protein